MKPFGVIFDKDGVITDNNSFHKDAWIIFCERHQINIDDLDFEKIVYGNTNETLLPILFNATFSEEKLHEMSEEKEAIYREIYDANFQIAPGLLLFLEELKSTDVPTALCSNAPFSNIDYTLDRGDIRGFFKTLTNPETAGAAKPDPTIYLKSGESLGIPPENCIVFEDSLTGLQAAIDAGMKTAAITSTYPKAELEKLKPDFIFDTFESINLSVVKKIIFS